MKFKRISTKMICSIIPVVILAMAVLTLVSMNSSRTIINKQITQNMETELEAQGKALNEYLNSVSDMAMTIANFVETGYTVTDMASYEKILANIISDNSIVLGSGLWFEPYAYDSSKEFMGPYVYKDGSQIVTTYDYSNADYDYFSQEYYTMCISADKPQFTNPYYDATSNTIMSSCACPMLVNGTYIGCVTVDIELGTITGLIEDIKVGKDGKAVLTASDGVYLAGADSSTIQNSVNITADDNASMAAAGAEILNHDSGISSYTKNGETINLYYATLENTGWKLILEMPQSELNEPLNNLVRMLGGVTLIAVILTFFVILVQIGAISKSIKQVQTFAGSLAGGDFTIRPIFAKSRDELGSLAASLNQMYESNKEVIQNIKQHSNELASSSQKLKHVAGTLDEKFSTMKDYMNEVNESMISTSAATQQVNASSEEVLSNVTLLTQQSENSIQMANAIQERAEKIGEHSRSSFTSTNQLSVQFEKNLKSSIENARVVESIGELAEVIAGIAEQINLLSLNASIEAARAGDAGRGFAVVAGEIGTLAGNTADAVGRIQSTIAEVQSAFSSLAKNSEELLSFVQETVTPDYKSFVEVAGQYGKDAQAIQDIAGTISSMSDTMKHIMQEVSAAIQNVTEATQQTTELSASITDSLQEVSVNVTEIADMSHTQDNIVQDLNTVASKFTVD